MSFELDKKKQLEMKDKSSKGSWDKRILGLIGKINKKKEYYTTSSCSGRIMLIKDSETKQPNLFLFVSHEKVELKKLLEEIDKIKYKELVWFKLDSCILHVAAKDLDSAEKLLSKAKLAGWKRSGIISTRRNIVELISTETMSFPVMKGKLLVSDDYLKLALGLANEKLERVWLKIDKLQNSL